jgi:hypothetical protein
MAPAIAYGVTAMIGAGGLLFGCAPSLFSSLLFSSLLFSSLLFSSSFSFLLFCV